jgi:hypothetical protein
VRDHEARIAAEAASRQALIEDLTVELAAAREEGERRARTAEDARAKTEAQLRKVLGDVSRIEGELGRLREVLTAALAPPAPVAAAPVPPPSSMVPHMGIVPKAAPPPLPADAVSSSTTSVAAMWGAKKKKIRLR